MRAEDELIQLRRDKQQMQEHLAQRDELIAQMQRQLVQRDELIAQMQQQHAVLSEQVQALQDQLKKDSHNSHLPPSSDRFHRQPKSLRQKSGKKAGGQPGHPGSTLMLSPTPDTVIMHAVEQCEHCQRDLRDVESLRVERRQVIDLPVKRVLVIEHQAQQKCCPTCQQISMAAFPENVSAPVHYGAAFGAVGVYLVQQHLLPYERACEVMQDLLGPSMSEKTLQTLVQRCAERLSPVEEQIKSALSQAEVLHQDETGLYVAGKRHWMHVSATQQLTHYAVHAKRGHEALDAIGILTDFHGVSVHDGWQAYWRYACEHGLCNVHHLRELIFLHEVLQQVWAGQMKDLLLDMKSAVDQACAEGHPIRHRKCARRDAANSPRRAICSIASPPTRMPCWPSWTTSPCLLTTALRSAISGWSKFSKKSQDVSVR
jgi:transposase